MSHGIINWPVLIPGLVETGTPTGDLLRPVLGSVEPYAQFLRGVGVEMVLHVVGRVLPTNVVGGGRAHPLGRQG